MQYIKYFLWLLAGFFILVGVGGGSSKRVFIFFGLIVIVASFYTKIKVAFEDYSSSKAQDDLLKLKSLLDQGVLTEDEYNKKAKKLKEKI